MSLRLYLGFGFWVLKLGSARPALAYTINNPAPHFQTFGDVFTIVIKNAHIAAGLLMFFYLIFGGFKYLTAAGDEKAVMAAKTTLTNAIIGMVIVFCSYWIIWIIQVVLGVEIISTYGVP